MNKKIFFLLLFIPIITFSQVQQDFYVQDVETIEYLTLSFCVDNEGKTNSVTIIPENTSYKNNEFIQQVIKYRKGIEYSPNSKLRNNCYESTFNFINHNLKDKKLTSSECQKGNEFRKGRFIYKNSRYSDFIIIRRKNIQIEKNKDEKYTYKIEWLSPCHYTLTYHKVSEKKYEYLIGEIIDVKIIDILKDGKYIYKSNLLDRTILTGMIEKLN